MNRAVPIFSSAEKIVFFPKANIKKKFMDSASPLFTNDAVVLGLLMATLAVIFITSGSSKSGWKKFYTYVINNLPKKGMRSIKTKVAEWII